MQLHCKVLLPLVTHNRGVIDNSNGVVPEQFNKTVKKLSETCVSPDLGCPNLGGALYVHEWMYALAILDFVSKLCSPVITDYLPFFSRAPKEKGFACLKQILQADSLCSHKNSAASNVAFLFFLAF